MPAVLLSPIGMITQLLSDQGVIGSGFKVNTYVGGSVSTPQATYTDSTGTTLNSNPIIIGSNGRYQSVTVWAVPGTLIKMVVQDANNNTIPGLSIDNIPLINDTTTILASLANPVAGSGADLVANAVKSYDIVTSVQAAPVPTLAAGQTLIIWLEGLTVVGDGLGGPFYWSVSSSASDDGGLTTIKPTAAGGTGRFLRITRVVDLYKTAITTQASNTTLTIDPDLQVVLPIGKYNYEFMLNFSSSAVANGGIAFSIQFAGVQLTVPLFAAANVNNTGSVLAQGGNAGAKFTFATLSQSISAAFLADSILIKGSFAAAASGTFALWWAQNTSSVGNASVYAGSTMRVSPCGVI